MLVLKRNRGEKVVIAVDGNVLATICIVDSYGSIVRLGFDADSRVKIHREEVWDAIKAQGAKPAAS